MLGTTAQAARARRDIGFVFQDASLLAWRTALENVELPLEVGGGDKRRGARDPRELLALVGLVGLGKAYPHEFSGGMRQRVAIARALVNDPKLLLMDEPFGALDEITRDRLNEELLRLWENTGATILFVTHSIYEAAFLGQQVMLMAARPGRVREIVPVPLAEPAPHRDARDAANSSNSPRICAAFWRPADGARRRSRLRAQSESSSPTTPRRRNSRRHARLAAWRRRLLPLGAAILLLVLWQLAVVVFHIRPFIAPAPTAVAATLYDKFGLLIGNLAPTAIGSDRRLPDRQ